MLGAAEADASLYEPPAKLFHPSASALSTQYYNTAIGAYGGGGLGAYGMGAGTAGLYGTGSPASSNSYCWANRALKSSAAASPYAAYFPSNAGAAGAAAPSYYASNYAGNSLDAAYGAAAYTYGAYGSTAYGAYPSYAASVAPTSPSSPTTYTLAQLPPSSTAPPNTLPPQDFPAGSDVSPFPKPETAPKKGKSKKKKAPNPSPSPESEYERVFIWDLDETCILLDSLLDGAYGAKYSKGGQCLNQIRSKVIQLNEMAERLAVESFHYGELEVRECDQVQIEDAALEEAGVPESASPFGAAPADAAAFAAAAPPGLRGGVDWMRKLSFRYRRIRELYALYRDSPAAALGNKQEAWAAIHADLELLTSSWTTLVKAPLRLVSQRHGYVNVVITADHLVPAVVKTLLSGFAPYIPIENIYSARKVGREAILERILSRFGKKATYVMVGSHRDEAPAARSIPHWTITCHDHLATLAHAIEKFL